MDPHYRFPRLFSPGAAFGGFTGNSATPWGEWFSRRGTKYDYTNVCVFPHKKNQKKYDLPRLGVEKGHMYAFFLGNFGEILRFLRVFWEK
jgi:hypothetical protein